VLERTVPVTLLFHTQPLPLSPTLFPYTTLFRSNSGSSACVLPNPMKTGGCPSSRKSSSRCEGVHPGSAAGHQYPQLTIPSCQSRSEEHTSELQSRENLVCRLLLEKKNKI